MWFNSRIWPCQGRDDGATPSTRSIFRGCSSSAERSFDMREAKRAALFIPTISEGIAQPARADASHASGRRRKSSCPHQFCPCGVVSQHACLSCRRSPERSRSGTPISSARGSRGRADPPDSESGSLGRASRLAPTIFNALKAFPVMRSLGRRANSVQLRVGAPFQ